MLLTKYSLGHSGLSRLTTTFVTWIDSAASGILGIANTYLGPLVPGAQSGPECHNGRCPCMLRTIGGVTSAGAPAAA